MIENTITVTVSEEPWGMRLNCTTCGYPTEKFEIFGHWHEDDGYERIVCWRCIEHGGQITEALEAQAKRLERGAAWCREHAAANWELPTLAELEAARARHDAMWDAQVAGLPQ